MTTTIDETAELHADGMPVAADKVKKSAVTASLTPAVEPDATTVRPNKDWFSGWCGGIKAEPCKDGRDKNNVGEAIFRCLYFVINGDKAPHKVLYCACTCHNESRDVEDPNFKAATA